MGLCVVSLTDASSFNDWSNHVHLHNAHWALSRGYTTVLNTYARSTWEIPMQVNKLLHTSTCEQIMYMDADAIVANVSWSIPEYGNEADVLFTSHKDGTINSGVFFVNNTKTSRRVFEWWSTFGNKTCAKFTQWPEQTCAQKIPSIWQSTKISQNLALNYPVDIFQARHYEELSKLMQECIRTKTICHPYGVKFWCKHRKKNDESLKMCTRKARLHLFHFSNIM
jgi:hypothetical protein